MKQPCRTGSWRHDQANLPADSGKRRQISPVSSYPGDTTTVETSKQCVPVRTRAYELAYWDILSNLAPADRWRRFISRHRFYCSVALAATWFVPIQNWAIHVIWRSLETGCQDSRRWQPGVASQVGFIPHSSGDGSSSTSTDVPPS